MLQSIILFLQLNVEEYYENDYYAIDPVQNTNLYIILEKKLDLPKYAKWTCPKVSYIYLTTIILTKIS